MWVFEPANLLLTCSQGLFIADSCILNFSSMIHGKHGTPQEPHYYLTVGKIERFSSSINTGFLHGTLKLGSETNGYSEIGGLVIRKEYRGHELKLGKFLSFKLAKDEGCEENENVV